MSQKSRIMQRFALALTIVVGLASRSVVVGQEGGANEAPPLKKEGAAKPAATPNAGQKTADDVKKLFGDSKAVIAGDSQTFGAKSQPEAVAVVEKYLTAIGGKDMLGKIIDRKAKFSNIKYSATGQTEAEIALFMQKDHKYREEWEIKGFSIKDEPLAFIQIYNGEMQEGWVSMLGTVSVLEGRTLSVFVWDKYLDDFFAHWEGNGYSLRKVGEGLVDDEACEIVECRDFTGRQKIRYFFSQESGLLKKKEWFDTTGKNTVKKEQFYKQYRRLKFADGSNNAIQFALQLDIHVDGELDTRREYTEVAYNSKFSPKIFEKPEGVPFAPEITNSKKGVEGGTGTTVGPHGAGKSRRSQGSKTRGRKRTPATGTKTPATGAKAFEGANQKKIPIRIKTKAGVEPKVKPKVEPKTTP